MAKHLKRKSSDLRDLGWGMTGQKGAALVLVLWVLTLLSVIVMEFCRNIRTEARLSLGFKEQAQAHYLARAGYASALDALLTQHPKSIRSGPSKITEIEEVKPKWRINAQNPPQTLGAGLFEVAIENTAGKINLNRANARLLQMMVNHLEIDTKVKAQIVDSILDWRDGDNLHRLNGAEDEYYESLPEPYSCKDAAFDSIQELLRVRGVSPEIYYGGLEKMVTVYPYGRQASIRSDRGSRYNYNKININAAPVEVLLTLPRVTPDIMEKILEYRQTADFESLEAVRTVVGPSVFAALAPYISLTPSPIYEVRSTGRMTHSAVREIVMVIIEIDPKAKRGYRVVRWNEAPTVSDLKRLTDREET